MAKQVLEHSVLDLEPRAGVFMFGPYEEQLPVDFVEKVAPLFDLRQNCFIGQRGITEHDGTVIEWAGATVLLVQP